MQDYLTAHWPLFVLGALLVVVLLWWLLMASRRTRVSVDKRDTLDAGAAPAARNQALIDAPPAATIVPPMTPDAIGGAGVAIAAAAEQARIATAEATGTDNLTRIKGLGPRLAAALGELGVTRFDQIANWNEADIARIDSQLGRFQGRIERDDWVGQARLLAAGDEAGFKARFGAV